jgi:nucleotide-binding universal stress UspA family protein
MTYKNLLVHLDDSRSCARRVAFAIDLAAAHEAHLTGLYVIAEASPSAFMLPPGVMNDLQRQGRERADAALADFGEAARRNRVAFEARLDRVLYTEIADAVLTNARYADLAILGQNDPDEPTPGPRYLPEEVALGGGRPVLIVPYIGAGASFGERAVVAWDASREAARAVNDALPLLRRAQKVGVVSVNPRPWPFAHGEEPGADIGLHLARHGVKVEVQRIEARDVDVPNALLSHLADQSADLLVMGAYGHSRLREFVLGGTTRTILAEMTVPTLMSH